MKRKKESKKNKDSLRSLWDNSKHTNICITEVPEEETEQEIRNLFEKILNKNFPNLVKEIDMQVQKAQRPKQDRCRETHSKTHHN